MPSINDALGGFVLPGITFNTAALSSSTAAAGQLSGTTPIMVMNNSGATPGTYTTRSATQMITDSGLQLGQTWWVILVNGQTTGTLTLAAGSGGTASGTLTVAPNTARLFIFQITGVTTPAFTVAGQAVSCTATALAFGV